MLDADFSSGVIVGNHSCERICLKPREMQYAQTAAYNLCLLNLFSFIAHPSHVWYADHQRFQSLTLRLCDIPLVALHQIVHHMSVVNFDKKK